MLCSLFYKVLYLSKIDSHHPDIVVIESIKKSMNQQNTTIFNTALMWQDLVCSGGALLLLHRSIARLLAIVSSNTVLHIKDVCQIFGRFDPKILIYSSIGILIAVEKVKSFHLSHCSKKSANY